MAAIHRKLSFAAELEGLQDPSSTRGDFFMSMLILLLLASAVVLGGCLEGEPSSEEAYCDPLDCGEHAHLDEAACACVCDEGYEPFGKGCVKEELDDPPDGSGETTDGDETDGDDASEQPDDPCAGVDCSDSQACNGEETCGAEGACIPGEPVLCGDNQFCSEPEGSCECLTAYRWGGESCVPLDCESDPDCILLPLCEVPWAPSMSLIHRGAKLQFVTTADLPIQLGLSENTDADIPDAWQDGDELLLDVTGPVKVFARVDSDSCRADEVFTFIYDVREAKGDAEGPYPTLDADAPGDAVHMDDPGILGWATGYQNLEYGSNVDEMWRTPEKTLGPAEGTSFGVVSLGRGGRITLSFDPPIANGPGADLAVFENAHNDGFLELAYVEVSSDGVHFLPYDSAYLGLEPVASYAMQDCSLFYGLAGRYRQGYGTAFDLEEFSNRREVLDNTVDLDRITHVRIADIVGGQNPEQGDEILYTDSFGMPIYDPYPTILSAGFDLDAVAVLNR